ncbi:MULTISPECIES: amidohydrolase family protein [unclassified Mesorhizobium]|uniref:amidohydrolase family protein n=1 Tax=unclassified Mesorhizobium TaxID=325217 RepID=UPI00167B720B|nr:MULTISPECIES: amidohydrolase family protein [unclassified Mesorhizobium]
MIKNHRVIALEEHYLDSQLAQAIKAFPMPKIDPLLTDFAEARIGSMDSAGVDFQILSHLPPALQGLLTNDAAEVAIAVNDRLKKIVDAAPHRFAAFASVPTSNPEAAARELARTVGDLGFVGAMIHGPTDGVFLDDPRFDPLFDAAQRLDVPLYLHPADPLPAVRDAYFGPLAEKHPMYLRAAWGYTIETATQAVRLILNNVFDRFPSLKIVLGHLGETLPYVMDRMDEALSRDAPDLHFKKQFLEHFYVTTSGFFSDAPLKFCIAEMGIERVMFSVDWPFASNEVACSWAAKLDLSDPDKDLLLHGNAERLFRLPT